MINSLIHVSENVIGEFLLFNTIYLAKNINDIIHIDSIANVDDIESIIVVGDTIIVVLVCWVISIINVINSNEFFIMCQ